MTADLWYLWGYLGAALAIQFASRQLYRSFPARSPGEPLLYPHRRGVAVLASAGTVAFAALAIAAAYLGAWLGFGWSRSGYAHVFGLAFAVVEISFLWLRWWMGLRSINVSFTKRRTVLASRGTWRSRLEWALALAFVAVAASQFVLTLVR